MSAAVQLASVVTVIRGVTFKPDELVDPSSESSVVVFRTKNVQRDLEEADLIALPSLKIKREEQFLIEGDLLLSSANSWELVGKSCYVGNLKYPATAGGFISIIRPNLNKLSPRYFYHWVTSPEIQHKIRHCGRQTTNISNLDFNRFLELEIPLPSIVEQKRIATILDKADALRRKRQQVIELADQFLRSVFLEMFGDPVSNPKGWYEAPLATGITRIESGWSAKGDNRPAGEGQVGVLKISSVTSGKFISSENKVVDESTVPTGKKLLKPCAGDLLFSRANTRDLVAATAIVNKDYDNLFLPDKLWKIQTNELLLPEFLNFLLWHQRMRDRLRSQATGTSGSMLNISKRKFEETSAIFPPIEKQRKFVEMYRKARAISEKYSSSSDLTEKLFASASQEAFSGPL